LFSPFLFYLKQRKENERDRNEGERERGTDKEINRRERIRLTVGQHQMSRRWRPVLGRRPVAGVGDFRRLEAVLESVGLRYERIRWGRERFPAIFGLFFWWIYVEILVVSEPCIFSYFNWLLISLIYELVVDEFWVEIRDCVLAEFGFCDVGRVWVVLVELDLMDFRDGYPLF
jgi:hypothetical protein